MRRLLLKLTLLSALVLCHSEVYGQISTNPYKFLGNITTYSSMDTDGYKFSELWNQVTPENETKWSSVEGTRGTFSWWSADNSYKYAKEHGFPFKFHCLAWGSQYPDWLASLTPQERYKEIVKWMDAAKKQYPDLKLIDVVNEALSGHQQGTYLFEEALGGAGLSGYDWIVKAFELAYERWPDAILIYNDFNTFQYDTDRYIQLVQALIDAGAPIDAYGCQSHDLNNMSGSEFKAVMTKIQNALKLPMYITEYDINQESDAVQKTRFQEQIPVMWEADYCAGVTAWGYIQGKTWEDYSGISYGKGNERPAMKWLREYMKTEKAKTVGFRKNFPLSNGWTKEASVYVKPSTLKPNSGDSVGVTVRVRMKSKKVDHVVLYADNDSSVLYEAPFEFSFKAGEIGHKTTLKAIVYTTDGNAYTRYSHFTVCRPRAPYKGTPIELPGKIQFENFDTGSDGIAFHDSDNKDEGNVGYRKDNEGVDIVTGNGGYAIGYTNAGEWLEYTVNVTKAGLYEYDAVVSSGTDNSSFAIGIVTDGEVKTLATVNVPKTADNDWSKYTHVKGRFSANIDAGQQVIRVSVTGSSCNLDGMTLTYIPVNPDLKVSVKAEPSSLLEGDTCVLTATVTKPEGVDVKSVKFYVDGKQMSTATSEPYQYKYVAKYGSHTVKVIATDTNDCESEYASTTVTVNRNRRPYKNINLPGILQAEDFDVWGEGQSFHDSDSKDEGNVGYRKDNEGVDIITGNGGYAIGYTSTGEWLEYTVNVTEGGRYSYEAVVSSGTTGSKFSVMLKKSGGYIKLFDVQVPQTAENSWDTYRTVKGNIGSTIPEGTQRIRIRIQEGSCNIDRIRFICTTTGLEETLVAETVTYEVFSLTGVRLGTVGAESDESLCEKVFELTGKQGVYVARNTATGKSVRVLSAE